MKKPTGSRERLDVPLVWDSRRDPAGSPSDPQKGSHDRWPRWQLVPAILADLGVVLLALGAAYGVAWWRGASLSSAQLATASAAGLLMVSVLGVGALWAWRATPGMLLMGGCFAGPLPLGWAIRLWLVWVVVLPVAGIPLLLGTPRESLAERLAGGELSSRSLPSNA